MERHEPPARVLTPRLAGEPIGPEHFRFLCELLGDERVGRTLGGVRGAGEVAETITRHRVEWERDGFGWWVWRERASGEPVARGGIRRTTVEGEDVVEVGWAVAPAHWGEGIATELGRASLDVAGRLGIREVVAFALVDNVASRRVMEKIGMTYERDFVYGQYGPHALYRVST